MTRSTAGTGSAAAPSAPAEASRQERGTIPHMGQTSTGGAGREAPKRAEIRVRRIGTGLAGTRGMRWSSVLWLASALACGADEGALDRVAPGSLEFSGQYEVTGVTVERQSGAQRAISGRVLLVREDDGYRAHFELSTPYGGSGVAMAQVVGTGEGQVLEDRLEGHVETQLVLANVPGVDVGFAFVPREVGPRIVSQSVARFFEDGSIRVELQNEPASEEEDYLPTRTSLVGYRLGDAPAEEP